MKTLLTLGAILGVIGIRGGLCNEEEIADATQINCYACGFEEVSPELDEVGSYGDIRKDGTPASKKMYNHTCDIMDKLGASESWVRKCPAGIKSCFVGTGKYMSQGPKFRGCAGAQYAHENKCERQLQPVQMQVGKQSADVEVLLCHCDTDKCNMDADELNAAARPGSAVWGVVMLLAVRLW